VVLVCGEPVATELVLCCAGGRDGVGRPLITFVAGQHSAVAAVTEDVLMAEAAHLLHLIHTTNSTGGAAFLANFRSYTRDHMLAVVNVLEKLQVRQSKM
jgi:hypothetical protein